MKTQPAFLSRAFRAVNLNDFDGSAPDFAFHHKLDCPHDRQYVLRMMVKEPHSDVFLPEDLEWCREAIEKAQATQDQCGLRHGFIYLTVRHGLHDATTDDEWHVDGFSQVISHIPEQNYIATSNDCTEYAECPVDFPSDFDPFKHDIVDWINRTVDVMKPEVKTTEPDTFYVFDPYVVHRRPKEALGKMRTFVRISFLPIEIYDDHCEPNPLMFQRRYNRIAKDARNKLEPYEFHRKATPALIKLMRLRRS